MFIYFFIKIFLMFNSLSLKERDRERVRAGEGQRERGRHRIWSRLQALGCQHRTRHRAQTHGPWDHDLSQNWTLNWLSYLSASLMFIYFWETETECEQGRGRGRGRHRIRSKLRALSCHRRARCGTQTHGPWDHDLSQSWTFNRLSHPGVPSPLSIL